jgi:hypothetical protein
MGLVDFCDVYQTLQVDATMVSEIRFEHSFQLIIFDHTTNRRRVYNVVK